MNRIFSMSMLLLLVIAPTSALSLTVTSTSIAGINKSKELYNNKNKPPICHTEDGDIPCD